NVLALDAFGNTATGYRGSVHFTSTDPQATLPADYTFTAADAGTHAFTAVVRTAGPRAITVTDMANPALTFTSPAFNVLPASTSQFTVTGFPSPVTAGTSGNFTVTARDAFGNVTPGFTGTVTFSSSADQSVLPAPYTFTAADQGVHTFSATL